MAVTGFWPVCGNLNATLKYADNPDKTTPREYLDEDLYAALRYVKNDNKTDTMKTQNFCFDWKNMGDNIQGEMMAYKVHYQ